MVIRMLSRWLVSIALAIFTLVVINLLVVASPVQSRHATAFVNCSGSIQTCIDAANDGDTILIAEGTYTESLTLSKPVSLTGVNPETTIIHAMAGQRVLTVTGAMIDNSVVISGLTFTSGNVTSGSACPASCGGGIALLNMAQPRIDDVILQRNQAGYGGGIYAEPESPLLIDNSQFISNTAGDGGGVYAGDWSQPGSLVFSRTVFIDNAATRGGGLYILGEATLSDIQFEGNTATDLGGAINARNGTLGLTRAVFIRNNGSAVYSENSPAVIVDSHFEQNSGGIGGAVWLYYVGANISHTDFISNFATLGGGGVTMINGSIVNSLFEDNTVQENWGGGLYAMGTTFVTNTDFISNSALSNGGGAYFGNVELYDSYFEGNSSVTGGGGGFFAFGTFISHTDMIGNQAGCSSWGSGCGGGGAYAFNEATVVNSRFENNVAKDGGSGGGLSANDAITIMNNVFISNSADFDGGGLFAGQAVALASVDFISNTAFQYGGGVYISNTATLSGTDFMSNTAQQSGGGAYLAGSAKVFNSRFESNQTLSGDGGGMLSFSNPLDLTSTTFIRNSAISAGGGGLAYGGSHARIINSLFAGNTTNMFGAAVTTYPNSEMEILNSTITDPGSNPQWAITNIGAELHVTNTIITSHSLAIAGTYQRTTEDYNLFYGNINNTVGVITGAHSFSGDPHFVDPAHDDYHLVFPSPAIDHGIDAGVYTDLDGYPRPHGASFDIGAYEYQGTIYHAFLPIVRR